MRQILSIIFLSFLVAACGDANSSYVRKAVRIMDLNGIYAQGDEWEKAKAEALSANPASLEEAQDSVVKAGKVACGKHTFLMTADDIQQNAETEKEMPSVETTDSGITLIKLPHFSGNAQEGVEYARTFGSPTAGYASSNQPFGLPDGSQLVLTIGEDVARTGEVFCNDPIEPDVRTETPLEDACCWILTLN